MNSLIGHDNVPNEVEKVKVIKPAGQLGPISDIERRAALESTPLRQKYRAGGADHEAAHAFERRMLRERGIDPGQDNGVQPYQPNLYLKHVPSIDIMLRLKIAGLL